MPDFHELAGEWARSVGGWLVVGSLSGWDEEMVLLRVPDAVVLCAGVRVCWLPRPAGGCRDASPGRLVACRDRRG